MYELQELRGSEWVTVGTVDSQFVASLWVDDCGHSSADRRYVRV